MEVAPPSVIQEAYMELREQGVRDFFAYARERQHVLLRRRAGLPPPWTDDPVLRQNRFTCVFREDDRTTIWCREHVREPYDGSEEVLPAVVLFRWFNRIDTGEALFTQRILTLSQATHSRGYVIPFDYWVDGMSGSLSLMRQAIVNRLGSGPYTNPAYIVKSPDGMSKLDGVLNSAERFRTGAPYGHMWQRAGDLMAAGAWGLEKSWEWMREHPFQGDFTAYEVVTDLRHTHLLRGARDIMTWANAGPGAVRGLNRVQGRPVTAHLTKSQSLAEMRLLLTEAMSGENWPVEWPSWEMREVEHTLCEFDKFTRVTMGEGRAKQRYSGGGVACTS